MSTLSTLRSLLEREMGEVYPLITGTVDDMNDTLSLSDSDRAETDDKWNNCYIYLHSASGTAPDDEERRIDDFYSASTISVDVAFTSSAGDGYTYYIREKASKQQYEDAINGAIRAAQGAFLETVVDETTIVGVQDQHEYTLPSGCLHIFSVDLENADVADSGTASSSSSTTLVDSSKSWDTDEWNTNYAVVIYTGTGEGQQRTITDTTSTTLTVATWTTNPDTTSKYKIKYIGREELRWAPIRDWYPTTSYSSGSPTRVIHFGTQPSDGMSVRIQYAARPSELTSDSATTDIPDEYIKCEGLAQLHQVLARRVPGMQDDNLLALAAKYRADAQRIMETDPVFYRLPPTRIQERGTARKVYPADYPFRIR